MGQVIDFLCKNRGLAALFLLVMVSGCSGKQLVFNSTYDGDCQPLWAAMEGAIQAAEVADPTVVRVEGFPYLRSNRYLQALATRAADREEQTFVLEEMRRLDLEKRALELTRIPADSLAALAGPGAGSDPGRLETRLSACSQQFLADDQQSPDFFDQVRRGIELDRDYSLWLRSAGLYPLTSLVVAYIAERAQGKMVDQFSSPVAMEREHEALTFRPQDQPAVAGPDPAALLRRSRRSPMLSLDLTDQELLPLVRKFAPLLTIANGAAENRFGRIVRQQDGFVVDGHEPVVYYYLSQTLVQDIPALQINYAIWFSERTDPAPWYEHGNLDGLLFRVTLDWRGRPIFVDVSFQCGCYHFVMYNGDLVSGIQSKVQGFQPFIGGRLPKVQGEERLHFAINSGWHQIARIEAAGAAKTEATYQLLPYVGLEYYKHENEVISLFDDEGRVPGTNRLERFFLFSMGIPKVGAMRQRGRQPITLIGRAYLDSPDLFDKNFTYQTSLPDLGELLVPGAAHQKAAPGKTQTGDE